MAESDVFDGVAMSLDGLKKSLRFIQGPTDGVDLMTEKLVHEDFALSQMSGDQEEAVRDEDSPQFSQRSAELIPSQVLDGVEGDGTGERSRCEREVAHVPTHRPETRP